MVTPTICLSFRLLLFSQTRSITLIIFFGIPSKVHQVSNYLLTQFQSWSSYSLWDILFPTFLSSAFFFQNQLLWKILSGIRSLSNRLDPDQVRLFVGADLGQNCLQRLSAEQMTQVGKEPIWLFCLIWYESLHPSRQFFSYVGTGLPRLNQYQARINVTCSSIQHSDAGEALTRGPSVSSQALYYWASFYLIL